MDFSITFDIKSNREIGLKFLASVLIPFLNKGFILTILHCDENVSSFIDRLLLARRITITGAPSLGNLEEIWSIPEALATCLKSFQLMLHPNCVKQNPYPYCESAYNTVQWFWFQICFLDKKVLVVMSLLSLTKKYKKYLHSSLD